MKETSAINTLPGQVDSPPGTLHQRNSTTFERSFTNLDSNNNAIPSPILPLLPPYELCKVDGLGENTFPEVLYSLNYSPPPPSFSHKRPSGPLISETHVIKCKDLIPTHHLQSCPSDFSGLVHTEHKDLPVFLTYHVAGLADFKEHEWIIKKDVTNIWYEKPNSSLMKRPSVLGASGSTSKIANQDPTLKGFNLPYFWVSPVLTTPTCDELEEFNAEGVKDSCSESSRQSRDLESEEPKNTPLVYYLVFSVCEGALPCNTTNYYKLVKCGTRKGAASIAHYGTIFERFHLKFCCVMAHGDGILPQDCKIKRVTSPSALTDKNDDENKFFRVFY